MKSSKEEKKMKYVLGVDIGGTNIRAGLVNEKGKILDKIKIRTEAEKGRKKVIGNIISAIDHFSDKEFSAIGLGIPGILDLKNGIIQYSPNLPLNNTRIRDILIKTIKRHVFIDNDANCFVLGEHIFGSAKNKKDVIGLTLGTGFGSGIILDGNIYHGNGSGPELGHTTINFQGPRSKCGNDGCVETYVSIRGIMERAKDLNIKEPRELFELAREKNKKALELWKETGFYLGIALSNFINIFNPEMIVVGGNIAKAWDYFEKEMTLTIKKRALTNNTRIVKSKFDDDSGILGAASLCIN